MILIGENINIMSKSIGPALKAREQHPIQELAKAEDTSGMDYLEVNIGPARKDGAEFMTWVVKTVQQVSNKPLSLDTVNPLAMEAGLKVHQGKALINSISLQPDRLEQELPLVMQYNADMIGLLWGMEGMPRDANERCMLAVDIVYKANQAGIPNERIWIDPIATPVSGEINQVKASVEFMGMLNDIAPGCKSIVGLSNVSNGTPAHLRPYLNRTYLMMLMKHGLHSAIVDAFDQELKQIALGQMPHLVQLIHRLMNGETIDTHSLNVEEVKYFKTFKVLIGDSLYSHSWLDV